MTLVDKIVNSAGPQRTPKLYPKRTLFAAALFLLACARLYFLGTSQTAAVKQDSTNSVSALSALQTLQGQVFGTSYTLRFVEQNTKNIQQHIDQRLARLDHIFSTYRQDSAISQLNIQPAGTYPVPQQLAFVLRQSQNLSRWTLGAFDPTLLRAVESFGFGAHNSPNLKAITQQGTKRTIKHEPASEKDRKTLFAVHTQHPSVTKYSDRLRFDLNAIAKGYAVDAIALWLENQGVKNFMLEIGGEMRTSGHPPARDFWRIGIKNPGDPAGAPAKILRVSTAAVATSGSYFQKRLHGGKLISHIINPQTGQPATTTRVSATVYFPNGDCLTADALATALLADETLEIGQLKKRWPSMSIYLLDAQGNPWHAPL